MSRFTAAFATLVILLAMIDIAGAAPFQNGSFEIINSGPSGNWGYFHVSDYPAGITGWAVVNQSYVTPYPNTNGVVRGQNWVLGGWFGPIPDGAWVLAVGTGWGGGIEQTFDTIPGNKYLVSFAAAANPWGGSNTTNLLRFRAPGVDTNFLVTDGGHGTTDMRWQQESATFTAVAAQSKINFECADTYFDGLGYPFIDNVTVQAQTDNLESNFSTLNNPSGDWDMGYIPAEGSHASFGNMPYSATGHWSGSIPLELAGWGSWQLGSVTKNVTGADYLVWWNGAFVRNGGMFISPSFDNGGQSGKKTSIRWTSPFSGRVSLNAVFKGIPGYWYPSTPPKGYPTCDVHVKHNGVDLWEGYVNGTAAGGSFSAEGFAPTQTYTGNIYVTLGDTIDFVVGPGLDGAGDADRLDLAVTITKVQLSQPGKIIFVDEGSYWHFRNDEFEGYISKSTGLLNQLTSLKPSIKNIIPSGGNGLTLYIKNQTAGWTDQLNMLDTASVDQGTEDGHAFHRLTCTLRPSSHNVASARIEYKLFDDYLGIKSKVNYLANDSSQYKVGVYQPFDPSTWPKQQYYNWAHQSAQKLTLRYSYEQGHYNDTSWDTALYPMALLISPDRYFLWGYLDLASHVVLSPNDVPNISPSFAIYPTGITNGNSYSFDFVYKTFPRPGNTYTEALRWYGEHFYDSDPDFNQGPVRLEHQTSRTIGYGNSAIMIPDYSLLPGAPQSPATVLALENWMLSHNIVHLWYMKLNDWRESGPTSGTFNLPLISIVASAQDIKNEIARLQAKGFKVDMYFRQAWWFKKSEWLSPSDVTSPPYKRWINRKPDGSLVSLWYGEVGWGPYSFGENAIAGEIDFNNDEGRAWYFKRLKECVEYYNPDGIAFDFGWSNIFAATNTPIYSAADPNSDMFQGWLKIQYEVYKWLKQNHPEKKVFINGPGGTPAQLYCDGDMNETDTTSPHSSYNTASRAFNTGCMETFETPWQTESLYKTRLNTIPSIGSSYCAYAPFGAPFPSQDAIPYVQTISTDITGFTARTNAVPLVTHPRVLSANSYEIVGSVWASQQQLMTAVYNNDPSITQIQIKVDRAILNSCGQTLDPSPTFQFKVIDANGNLKSPTSSFNTTIGTQYLTITGNLGKNELLLVELADTTPPTTPGIPTDAGAYTNNTSVAFNWIASSDTGSGIAGYNCQVGTTPGGTNVFSGTVGNTLMKTITGSSGNTYYCRVQATDNAGNLSAWSASSDGIAVVEHVGIDIGSAKGLSRPTSVGLASKPVTAIFSDRFYIQEQDRSAGIMVKPTVGLPSGLAVGKLVDVGGVITANSDHELWIDATVSLLSGTTSIRPLGLANRSIGGSDWQYGASPARGQRGITGAYGLNNIGLLVRTWGRVIQIDGASFSLDDGSGVGLKVVVSAGVLMPAPGTFVKVTGVVSCYVSAADLRSRIFVRGSEDIVELH